MTRMFHCVALAALIGGVLATPVDCFAQQAIAASASQPSRAASLRPGDFYLDTSRVFVKVDKTGLGHEHGVVGKLKSGSLRLGAAQNAGQMVFDMASFRADTADARKYVGLEGATSDSTQRQVTDNMLGHDVLDAASFPTATFKVNSASRHTEDSKRGAPQYLLKGEFTLHGQTRPLQMLAEVERQNGWDHVRCGFRINQSDFGIKPFTKAFGAIGVADQLTIWGDAWVAPTTADAP